MSKVAEDQYMAKATQAMADASKEKGTPFVRVMFQITEGEYKDRHVEWTGWLTEKTQERTVQSLLQAGWKGDDIGEFNSGTLNGLGDVEVRITVEHEADRTDPAKSWARVAFVNGKDRVLVSKLDADKTSKFGSQYKGLVHAMRQKMPADTGTDFPHGANAQPAHQQHKSF